MTSELSKHDNKIKHMHYEDLRLDLKKKKVYRLALG